jgi:hypothetical protein
MLHYVNGYTLEMYEYLIAFIMLYAPDYDIWQFQVKEFVSII